MALARPGVAFKASLRNANHNPGGWPSLHYFSALQKVICMACHAVITYDFKRLSMQASFQEILTP
jgi:hypothetical protein